MSKIDELETYAKGFKDGWTEAMKIKQPTLPSPIPWQTPPVYVNCPSCGAMGVRGQVCYNPNCPTAFKSYTGSFYTSNNTSGAQGS